MPPPITLLSAIRSTPALFFDTPRPGFTFYSAPIADPVALDQSNPKWIQLCAAGSYVYRGTPVDITPELLDRMVSNFRAHPSYDPSARSIFGRPVDEVAAFGAAIKAGVVALNFDHPPHGAPRPGHGWFLDVERRGSQLWGLVWMDPEAHAGMLSARWKWTSIEWATDAVDNRGQEIGPYLSGVALTNDPFITGMVPIQLSRPKDGEPIVWFGGATDALCELRIVLGLPETAGVDAVLTELSKLRTWALDDVAAPIGVDVGGLLARCRRILNLPTLSEPANIFAELSKLLGRVAEEEETKTTMGTETKTPEPSALARHVAPKLSVILRTPVEATDESVMRHFDGGMARYDEAMGHAMALQKMFGTTDAKAIAEKLSALLSLSDQVTALLGEVQAEHIAEEKAEGELAAADAMQVMQAQRLDPRTAAGTLQAYTAQRLGFSAPVVFPTAEQVKADPALFGKTLAAVRKRREERTGAKTAFFKAHGIETIIPVPQGLQHLYGPALFTGGGALFGAGNAGAPPPQGPQHGQAPTGHPGYGGPSYFGAPLQHGQGAPPPPPAAWSWARVAQLPPSQRGDNPAQRVFEEVVRVEFGGNAAGAKYDQAWSRANVILQQITRNEGPAPASFGN